MRLHRLIYGGLCLFLMGAPVFAQDDRTQTLADIRQELTVLFVELQKLRQELNTTGAVAGTVGGTALERVTSIESEVQRLTAVTERLQFRIDRVVKDGTNVVGDLEFRLCELEPNCDIATLGDTPTLGGDVPVTAPSQPEVVPDAGPELALGEERDFAAAQAALSSGDYTRAVDGFAALNEAYPGGPLAAAADLGRGEALEQLGDTREAARAYLQAFSTDQLGQTAPVALFKLGAALGKLGQTAEACVTLAEVAKRYPAAADAMAQASAEMQRLGCT